MSINLFGNSDDPWTWVETRKYPTGDLYRNHPFPASLCSSNPLGNSVIMGGFIRRRVWLSLQAERLRTNSNEKIIKNFFITTS